MVRGGGQGVGVEWRGGRSNDPGRSLCRYGFPFHRAGLSAVDGRDRESVLGRRARDEDAGCRLDDLPFAEREMHQWDGLTDHPGLDLLGSGNEVAQTAQQSQARREGEEASDLSGVLVEGRQGSHPKVFTCQ